MPILDAHDHEFVTDTAPDGNPRGAVLRITLVVDLNITGGVLVLPGGKPNSMQRSRRWQLAHLRMALLAWTLRRHLPRHVEVRRVRYRLRGWNPDRLDALRDARVALDDLLTHFDPKDVVVVGHSMGARVAAHLAASGDVGAVVALAPWWPEGDGDLIPPGRRLLTMHGTSDTWTDPVAARLQTERASTRGVDARWLPVAGAGHFLIGNYHLWHRTIADFAMAHWSARSAP